MATSLIGELPRRSFSIENTLKREAERQFLVRSDQPVRGALEASIACGVSFGDIYQTQNTDTGEYEYDSGMEAHQFSAAPLDPENDMTCWVITVRYSSSPLDPDYYTAGGGANIGTQGGGGSESGGGDGQNESPLAEPAKIVWGKRARSKALYQSLDVPPLRFVTGAGEPFTKVPEIDEGVLTLTITRNEATFDQVYMQHFWNTVNMWPFYQFLEYSVLCESITGLRDYRNKTQFHQVTYQFAIDQAYHGWNWRPVNKGTKYREAVGAAPKDALSATGRVKEVYLRVDGTLLPDEFDPILLDFTIYPEANFDELNLE